MSSSRVPKPSAGLELLMAHQASMQGGMAARPAPAAPQAESTQLAKGAQAIGALLKDARDLLEGRPARDAGQAQDRDAARAREQAHAECSHAWGVLQARTLPPSTRSRPYASFLMLLKRAAAFLCRPSASASWRQCWGRQHPRAACSTVQAHPMFQVRGLICHHHLPPPCSPVVVHLVDEAFDVTKAPGGLRPSARWRRCSPRPGMQAARAASTSLWVSKSR